MRNNVDKTLLNVTERFLADVAPYVVHEIEKKPTEDTEVTVLAIRAFNGIVAMCQEELDEADSEHLQHVLSFMCNIDVNASGDVLCNQIEGFVSHHIASLIPMKEGNDSYSLISENNLVKLIQLKQYGNKLRELVKNFIAQHKKRRWYQFHVAASKYRWAEELLAEVDEALKKISERIEYDSDKMIHKIVDNFYIIYICLLALVKYAISKHDIILELSVNAQIDRILYIIDPSFQAHALKNKYLLYYHVVYELKELHASILADM